VGSVPGAQQLHPSEVHGSVAVMRRPVAILLLFSLALLAPLAHASPPDPTWIHGVFDAADSDDAIVAATGTQCVIDGVGSPEAVAPAVAGAVPTSGSPDAPFSTDPVFRGRAPPAA